MSKIVIIGLTGNHHSLYILFSNLLRENIKKQIVLYILEKESKNFAELKLQKDVCVKQVKDSSAKTIKAISKTVTKNDTLIMDEFYGQHKYLIFTRFYAQKKILFIHNANKYYCPRLKYDPRRIIEGWSKNKFIKRFDSIISMGPNIRDYIKDIGEQRPIFYFPFDQPQTKTTSIDKKKERIEIVIPGMISQSRRNYIDLLEALELFYCQFPKSIVFFIFLGRVVNKTDDFILKKIDEINSRYGKKIKYFTTFVPLEEFEKSLTSCDFILSNVHVYNNLKDRIEIYGVTKESGVSFTIYKYNKPAIVPESQHILAGFDTQLIKFSKYDELFDIFKRIENGYFDIDKLRKEALINQTRFNEKVTVIKEKIIQYII